MKPTIIYEYGPSGNCPVQAEGTIDGYPFYFRARGGHWALYVARSPDSEADMGEGCWTLREPYDGVNRDEPTPFHGQMVQFGAGWAEKEECVQFIERAALKWKEARK